MTARRLPQGGRIDRGQTLDFTWDGARLTGFAGDTLASALLANGVRVVGRSFKYHRPRGIYAAWVEEPNAIMDLTLGGVQEPNARATTIELRSGLIARSVNAQPDAARDRYGPLDLLHRFLPAGFYYKTFFPHWHRYEPRIRAMAGLGRVAETPDARRFETRAARCDVLVVGGGPAGLAAARAAAAAGASVILADDRTEPGGSLHWSGQSVEDRPGLAWAEEVVAELGAHAARVMPRTTVFGAYDHNAFGLLERRPSAAAGWAEERMWTVRARQAVLATGAIERPLVFPGNDRPGVMSAAAVLHYLRYYAVLAGESAVVLTNNDSAYETALALRAAGAAVIVADLRRPAPPLAEVARAAGIRVLPGSVVLGTFGHDGVRLVDLGPAEARSPREATMRVPADLVAVSGGWSPAVHLHSQAGGKLRWDAAGLAFLPAAPQPDQHHAGAVAGATSLDLALASGHMAGLAAAHALGRTGAGTAPPRAPQGAAATPARPYWRVPIARARQWIDLQNDVTVQDVELAARENYSSVEHLKRYTTLGMATDQGKTSNLNGLAVLAEATGREIPDVGTTTFRPPYVPVTLGAVAGMRHGRLHAPWRRLPAHAAHVGLGAEIREYGGWMRPACYPRPGETVAQAIQREAAAVRAGVGLFDGSSLGKVVVDGPDAATFLNLMFYNEVANFRPGRIRYVLLLRETGIVFDDGVVARLSPTRFLLSPSSSHTAGVVAMLEAWRQTEYPALRVAIHDTTAAWATYAVSGPRARDVLAPLTEIDLAPAALPHMALAHGAIGGVAGRVARVSFTGERSYEVSVPAGYGPALFSRLLDTGAPFGITPYGIESLSVLRAEKGYILIGTDTDGTTLPDDLGMAAPLRTKQVEFVGRRSLLMPDATRAGRRQFVGLLTEDRGTVAPVGAHAIERLAGGRLRSLGWVTTACHSPALGRSIALGMIAGGRALAEIGATVELYHLGRTMRARVTSPVFFDPAGERLHG
jgi:sarcosine oxidase subunit alpha